MKSAVLTPRSEIVCFFTILVACVLFCCAPFLLLAAVLRWLYRQANLTARELYQDRWELAAYLLALAVLAFIIFFYPFQP